MHSFRNEFFTCLFKIQNVQVIQNDVIKCCKMMSSNVALLHSNNCCVLEPAICEDLDLHVVFKVFKLIWIFFKIDRPQKKSSFLMKRSVSTSKLLSNMAKLFCWKNNNNNNNNLFCILQLHIRTCLQRLRCLK